MYSLDLSDLVEDESVEFFHCVDGDFNVQIIDARALPSIVKYQEYAGDWILKNSKKRYELIERTLSHAAPNIGKEDIRGLLSKEIYDGVCGHYCTDYFGTLFSIIYDLTELKVDICFGAPTHNRWQKPFSLDDPVRVSHYSAVLPDRSITADEL